MLTFASGPRWPARANASVEVGQQFVEVGGKRRVVRVVAVIRPPCGVPHARIRPSGRGADVTLVSCAALKDPCSYLPLVDDRDPVPVLMAPHAADARGSNTRRRDPAAMADRWPYPVDPALPRSPAARPDGSSMTFAASPSNDRT